MCNLLIRSNNNLYQWKNHQEQFGLHYQTATGELDCNITSSCCMLFRAVGKVLHLWTKSGLEVTDYIVVGLFSQHHMQLHSIRIRRPSSDRPGSPLVSAQCFSHTSVHQNYSLGEETVSMSGHYLWSFFCLNRSGFNFSKNLPIV